MAERRASSPHDTVRTPQDQAKVVREEQRKLSEALREARVKNPSWDPELDRRRLTI